MVCPETVDLSDVLFCFTALVLRLLPFGLRVAVIPLEPRSADPPCFFGVARQLTVIILRLPCCIELVRAGILCISYATFVAKLLEVNVDAAMSSRPGVFG